MTRPLHVLQRCCALWMGCACVLLTGEGPVRQPPCWRTNMRVLDIQGLASALKPCVTMRGPSCHACMHNTGMDFRKRSKKPLCGSLPSPQENVCVSHMGIGTRRGTGKLARRAYPAPPRMRGQLPRHLDAAPHPPSASASSPEANDAGNGEDSIAGGGKHIFARTSKDSARWARPGTTANCAAMICALGVCTASMQQGLTWQEPPDSSTTTLPSMQYI